MRDPFAGESLGNAPSTSSPAGEANPNPYLSPHHIGKDDDDYTLGFEPTSLDIPISLHPAPERTDTDGRMPSSSVRSGGQLVTEAEREHIRLGLAEFLERYPEDDGPVRSSHRAERDEVLSATVSPHRPEGL